MARPARIALLLATAATLLPGGGCQNPCENFNPYEKYERLEDPSAPDAEPVSVEPGKFKLACYISQGDPSVIERVLSEALKESGGGSISPVSDQGERDTMLTFARGIGGPYTRTARPQIKTYEVTFTADDLDPLTPMRVEWTGNLSPLVFDLAPEEGEPAAPVTLLLLAPGEYQLVFSPEAGSSNAMYVAGHEIVPKGAYHAFKSQQFQLIDKTNNKPIQLKIADERAELMPEARVQIYEVTGFKGDVSKFLCTLLRENHALEGTEGLITSFAMKQTDVWLDAEVFGGVLVRSIRATFTHSPAGKVGNYEVEVPGLGTFGASDDVKQGHTLTYRIDENQNRVTFEFNLPTPEKEPKEDTVTFKYTVGGQEYSKQAALQRQ